MVHIPPLLECQKLRALRPPGGETRSTKAGANNRQFLGKTVITNPPRLGFLPPRIVPDQVWSLRPWFMDLLFSASLSSPFWFPTKLFQSYSQQLQFHFLELIFKYLLASFCKNTNCDPTTRVSSFPHTTDANWFPITHTCHRFSSLLWRYSINH